MGVKRVLTVNNIHSLLMDSVEHLLGMQGKEKFEVVSISATDLADLIDQVEELKPNVIILLEEGEPRIKPADLFTSAMDVQNLRLIVLNIQTNKVDVYDRWKSTFSRVDHLIEAVNYNGFHL